MIARKLLVERFWSKVDKSGECWVWVAGTNSSGYGSFWAGDRMRAAHRMSYEAAHGIAVPADVCVCHRCDNPPCVRPDHLFLGTVQDNNADKARKGRQSSNVGERNPRARLSVDDVRQVRALLALGISQSWIASRFDIGQPHVSKIYLGKEWRSA